jgi:NAD(P)-dependent dehydrogenase (short-subunit alcohol dehydrogenase family)
VSGRRVAVVTGAGSGVGTAYARRLAELGFDVAVCDLRTADATVGAVRALGRRAMSAVADVSVPADVDRFAAAVRERLGDPAVLVNNVGISPAAPFEAVTLDGWRQVMAVNLDSLFLVSRAFLPAMRAAGWGRIVNVSSLLAFDAEARDVVPYATSKMGVVGFTRALAAEVGADGVTVNCLCPGIVRTPLLERRLPAERWRRYLERQAIKRIAEPADLLAALTMLVSDEAAMITGANVPVGGGRVWA